ncbi:MAG: DNA cytosine methyltransferase [Candidatus Enteromonas sp.]|nr:DNA cytosine methyltransferase [Candidatus Enteromonas sp.]
MKDIIAIDLFCGAGGLSRGLIDAGIKVVLGIDWFDSALKTFEKNHNGAKAMKLDLFDHNNIHKIQDYLLKNNYQLDVLAGGPPCQGFSLAGKREEDDKRNVLYRAMVKTAELLKPKIVILENVPSILTLYDGLGKKRIFKDFKALGYKMHVKVLYAPEYGVPQIRRRAVFVGVLNGKDDFIYPKPLISDEKKFMTCEQAISDLPSLVNDNDYSLQTVREYASEPLSDYQRLMRANSKCVYNHYPTHHAAKTIENISMVPDGGNYKDLPPELASKFKYHESLHRYYSKAPSLTIDTGHRTHFHYKYNRIPTVRECARLQSFPDDFVFYGSKQEQYKEVGNAVPPLLGKVLGKAIMEYLEHEKV